MALCKQTTLGRGFGRILYELAHVASITATHHQKNSLPLIVLWYAQSEGMQWPTLIVIRRCLALPSVAYAMSPKVDLAILAGLSRRLKT